MPSHLNNSNINIFWKDNENLFESTPTLKLMTIPEKPYKFSRTE